MTALEKVLSYFDERIRNDSTDGDYEVTLSHRYSLGYVKKLNILNLDLVDQICLYLAMGGIQFTRAGNELTLYLTEAQVNG